MTEFVQKSVQSSVYKNRARPGDLRTVSSEGWTGEITVRFTGEFPNQTDADKFITNMTDSLSRLTGENKESFVDRVKREGNDVINTFNLSTTSGSAIWGEKPGDR